MRNGIHRKDKNEGKGVQYRQLREKKNTYDYIIIALKSLPKVP